MTKANIVHRKEWDTPFKLGRPLLAGSNEEHAFDNLGVDCPFVFHHGGRYMMMYVGFDGIGYQTALAESDDLLNWQELGTILRRNEGQQWDKVGAAGTSILKESNQLRDVPTLKKVDGKYWLVYHAYPGEGYESGAAEMGLAWTDDEQLMNWHRLEQPVYSWKDGAEWERGGLYKASLLEHEGSYYMFYNAKNLTEGSWVEQIGAAVSKDMLKWERCSPNPILPVVPGSWQSRFASDPFVVYDSGQWVMFYFGYDGSHAQEGVAVSDDLLNWTRHPEPIIRHGEPGELDEIHAHKPSLLVREGVLYHFYCAVRPLRDEDTTQRGHYVYRTITLAASTPVI